MLTNGMDARGQRHRKKVGLRRPTSEDLQRLRTWLTVEILPQDVSFERLHEMAVEWFVKQSLAPLELNSLERLLRSTTHALEADLFQAIDKLLNTVEH